VALAHSMLLSLTESSTRGFVQRSVAGNTGPVGMTNLFGNAEYSFQDELSSRPERTPISCHAALDRLLHFAYRDS
jgi:hypothetical protein